jgi:hypothetical protein
MAQPQTLVEGPGEASARLHGAQNLDPVFGNTRDQYGERVLASGVLYTAGPVEGVNSHHVRRPNMGDPPERGGGLEVQAGERVRLLKENVQAGEHVGSNGTLLERAAYGWLEDLSMKVPPF